MKDGELILISHKLCPFVQRARIVLNEKAIPHDIRFIDLANKPDWFLALSPLGKVPVLLVDGQPIFESAVIAEYLDETTPGSLHPENAIRRAHNRAWIEFASTTLASVATLYSAPDAAAFETGISTLETRFARLEDELDAGPWFNGSSFSLVDAAWAPVFRYFDVIERYDDFGLFDRTPRVRVWRDNLRERTSVRRAVVTDYPERLERFFMARDAELGRRIARATQAVTHA